MALETDSNANIGKTKRQHVAGRIRVNDLNLSLCKLRIQTHPICGPGVESNDQVLILADDEFPIRHLNRMRKVVVYGRAV